nr:hypothetical protein [Nesterenkonia sp. AN1]
MKPVTALFCSTSYVKNTQGFLCSYSALHTPPTLRWKPRWALQTVPTLNQMRWFCWFQRSVSRKQPGTLPADRKSNIASDGGTNTVGPKDLNDLSRRQKLIAGAGR